MILGHQSAREARRPAVFIIQPRQHPALFGALGAALDQRHEFGAQVLRRQPGARVHVKATKAHAAKFFDLVEQATLFERTVPAPEWRPAIAGIRLREQRWR